MKALVFSVTILALCIIANVAMSAQDKPATPLSEVQQLKAQNFALKVQVAQLQANLADRESKLASLELTKEQAVLQTEFLAAAKAPAGSTWDWSKMAVKEPDAPKPAPKK